MNGICDWKRCRNSVYLGYSPREGVRQVEVCTKHWGHLAACEEESQWKYALRKLGYKLREFAGLSWHGGKFKEEDIPMAKTKSSKAKTKSGKVSVKPINRKGNSPGKLKGETTGHSVREHWTMLFVQNEKAPKSKKMTDEQILKAMQKEFPGRTSYEFANVRGVQRVRNYFNTIGWECAAEEAKSQRYDATGNVMETKRGRPAKDEAPKKAKAKVKVVKRKAKRK